MGTLVVDAGVVIGWLAEDDAHHAAASAALRRRRGDDLAIPVSAYAEVLVRPIATGTAHTARSAMLAFGFRIAELGEATAEAAAALRARHRALRLPDALVLGHGEAIGADEVLTTDERWLAVSPRARLVA